VSLSGEALLVGALAEDDCPVSQFCDTGAAYLYECDPGGWVETAKLTAPDADTGDIFGVGVALTAERAAVGAFKDDDAGPDSGSVWIFDRLERIFSDGFESGHTDGWNGATNR
jgi:hypothetical protein